MNTETQAPKLVVDLVNRAAEVTGFNPEEHKTLAEKRQDEVKQKLKDELENLDITVAFTEMLIEKNHPDPAGWIPEIIREQPVSGVDTWRKQIHQFATRWITYLTLNHCDQEEGVKIRQLLAIEEDPFTWLGNVERSLVPFIMNKKLFMTEEQKQQFETLSEDESGTDEDLVVYEITPDGPVRVEATQEELDMIANKQETA